MNYKKYAFIVLLFSLLGPSFTLWATQTAEESTTASHMAEEKPQADTVEEEFDQNTPIDSEEAQSSIQAIIGMYQIFELKKAALSLLPEHEHAALEETFKNLSEAYQELITKDASGKQQALFVQIANASLFTSLLELVRKYPSQQTEEEKAEPSEPQEISPENIADSIRAQGYGLDNPTKLISKVIKIGLYGYTALNKLSTWLLHIDPQITELVDIKSAYPKARKVIDKAVNYAVIPMAAAATLQSLIEEKKITNTECAEFLSQLSGTSDITALHSTKVMKIIQDPFTIQRFHELANYGSKNPAMFEEFLPPIVQIALNIVPAILFGLYNKHNKQGYLTTTPTPFTEYEGSLAGPHTNKLYKGYIPNPDYLPASNHWFKGLRQLLSIQEQKDIEKARTQDNGYHVVTYNATAKSDKFADSPLWKYGVETLFNDTSYHAFKALKKHFNDYLAPLNSWCYNKSKGTIYPESLLYSSIWHPCAQYSIYLLMRELTKEAQGTFLEELIPALSKYDLNITEILPITFQGPKDGKSIESHTVYAQKELDFLPYLSRSFGRALVNHFMINLVVSGVYSIMSGNSKPASVIGNKLESAGAFLSRIGLFSKNPADSLRSWEISKLRRNPDQLYLIISYLESMQQTALLQKTVVALGSNNNFKKAAEVILSYTQGTAFGQARKELTEALQLQYQITKNYGFVTPDNILESRKTAYKAEQHIEKACKLIYEKKLFSLAATCDLALQKIAEFSLPWVHYFVPLLMRSCGFALIDGALEGTKEGLKNLVS